jgi:hypothetical protein
VKSLVSSIAQTNAARLPLAPLHDGTFRILAEPFYSINLRRYESSFDSKLQKIVPPRAFLFDTGPNRRYRCGTSPLESVSFLEAGLQGSPLDRRNVVPFLHVLGIVHQGNRSRLSIGARNYSFLHRLTQGEQLCTVALELFP